MKVKDLVDITIASMPIRVDTMDNETLIIVSEMFLDGECMLPNKILNMEVKCISLFADENDENYGLLINVDY